MPDLNVEFYYHCESAERFTTEVAGSKGKTYTVRFGRGHKRASEVQFDWSCDCEAYKYKPGYCKHIKLVIDEKRRCGWMQFEHGGEPKDDKCPECGGPVYSMGWAV